MLIVTVVDDLLVMIMIVVGDLVISTQVRYQGVSAPIVKKFFLKSTHPPHHISLTIWGVRGIGEVYEYIFSSEYKVKRNHGSKL